MVQKSMLDLNKIWTRRMVFRHAVRVVGGGCIWGATSILNSLLKKFLNTGHIQNEHV